MPHVVVAGELETADGFRGIWYANQASNDEYAYKYSGGMATYPQQHAPIAIYAPAVNKTFFCYGGRPSDKNTLLHMISYFDHVSGRVARPRILLNKKTSDAHDNPTLSIDGAGHIWIFSNSHGTSRPSFIHRSREPYSIDKFELIRTTNFSYGQPWHLSESGFVFLHTLYDKGRRYLHITRSDDGREWTEPQPLARVPDGHYQISWCDGKKLATAFNYHPRGKGLNFRTNMYYVESTDGGQSWQTARGEKLMLPLTEVDNSALALEYQSKGLLVYLKDLQFTADGRPVVLYLTSKGYESGPKNDPRTLTTAEWTGKEWQVRSVCSADNNYDYGSLYVEADGAWRIIDTCEPGPQLYNTGGEVALRVSRDRGASWSAPQLMTRNSEFNHNYPRRPANAHPEFYALWADGHAREPSESRLYFCNQDGSKVFRLPASIDKDDELVAPELMTR